ncbi:MAG: thiamine pyrophosphate-dependent enzyme [Chthoniobacterales bacterium]|nr:thiamine pyrophosphate-dependent enzyme [Chthoniobacterales bacterium]MCX7712808.1 thiamine pyrophosphate-dependent enzyme [Chthoniobacterales bacterium]
MTAAELIAFEEDIAAEFNAAKIRAPIHLYYGNEESIIDVFKNIRPQDWVLCSWRSHYQCLLKGVPPQRLKSEILAGRSISLCFPEYRILSSAIVGGVLPIAVGIAMGIQRSKEDAKVFCFMGDMTAETGIAHECIKYSRNHGLPITWIIEDNGKSVCTDTKTVWKMGKHWWETEPPAPDVIYYKYESKYPHAGAGVRVQF